jgi:alpha-galactosidase
MPRSLVALLVAGLLCGTAAHAQKMPGLAETPPMGWNSWNHFGCNIDERLIRETADAIVASGLRDAGYEYVNLDDCWHGERDADGFIQPDPERFPAGMKALADYVHGRGLRIGIYSDAGRKTCAGRPGSQGHEFQDALQYARWGIDYLKYDWCNTGEGDAQRNPIEAYTTMRDALHAAGRPIVFSICEWGENDPWDWAAELGHLWRTTGDIINCWDCEIGHGSWSSWGILRILDMQDGLRAHSGPGHWNDPDMMEVGNLDTLGENRAHFAMWAMLAAPLIIGTDVRDLDPAIRDVLANKGIVAVDQDPLGIQGFAHRREPNAEVWARPLDGGDWALAFLNRGDAPHAETFDFAAEPIEDAMTGRRPGFGDNVYRIVDLWTGEAAGTTAQPLAVTVGPRDVQIYRLVRGG